MKTKDQLFEFTQTEYINSEEDTYNMIQFLKTFSSITTTSIYVWDIVKDQLRYIKPGDLFLCGFSIEDAVIKNQEFYLKIVCPDDWSLCTNMYKTILQYLKTIDEKKYEIDYFSCTFRLQRNCSIHSQRTLSQMINHRTKPVWENGKLRYLICSVDVTTNKEIGNLCLHNIDGISYEKYNFTNKRWVKRIKVSLTKREEDILILAQQGKSSREIANDLCRAHNTIRNQIKTLFSKLKVHSMQEALEYASNHAIMYSK